MKIMQLTQYLHSEEAEILITFLEDVRAMLVAHYGEEIAQAHRTRLGLATKEVKTNDF